MRGIPEESKISSTGVPARRAAHTTIAERLLPETAEEILVDNNHRYPMLTKELARFMGYRLDGTEADMRALGRILPYAT